MPLKDQVLAITICLVNGSSTLVSAALEASRFGLRFNNLARLLVKQLILKIVNEAVSMARLRLSHALFFYPQVLLRRLIVVPEDAHDLS